jgi:hypothetical protein
MHAIGHFGAVPQVMDATRATNPYGWRRWAASLFAIYDTKRMVDLDIPWWNVAATREVDRFVQSRAHCRVFEYGAGASTAWLARRTAEVISVEHDAAFVDGFRDLLAPFRNVRLMERPIHKEPHGYVRAIAETAGQFDVVVVDGRYRADCLAAAIPRLKRDGIVLFDDSGRRRYRSAIEQSGLAERHYYGRSFCVPYPDHTSILTRRD